MAEGIYTGAIDSATLEELGILTDDMDLLPVRRVSSIYYNYNGDLQSTSLYFMEEEDLPDQLSILLHGRSFVIDKFNIVETESSNPYTFYVAADKTKGLVIPGRSMSINCELSDMHYRWTDDGIKWTDWITIPDGATDSYLPQELNRFAEIQVYSDRNIGLVSLRLSR